MSNEIDIQKTVSKVFSFLGLPDHKIKDFSRKNVESYEKINAKERNALRDFYEPYNKELEKLLDMKFNWN